MSAGDDRATNPSFVVEPAREDSTAFARFQRESCNDPRGAPRGSSSSGGAGQGRDQRVATASRRDAGIGRWTSTGVTKRSTMARVSLTRSSLNR